MNMRSEDVQRVAFVVPRFSEGPTIGGAETAIKAQAACLAKTGCEVSLLTTCARNHFTWANEIDPGERRVEGLSVRFFPVNEDRDIETFLDVQTRISRGTGTTDDEERAWLANSVNSSELCSHLREEGPGYDRIVAGPYLFGLTYAVAQIYPEKTILVPCLHDEPFAYVTAIGDMFRAVAGCMFNSEPERDLACRLYGLDADRGSVVGVGLEPFEADPKAFAAARGLDAPYVIYSGRREALKGTPLLLDYMCAFRSRTGRDVKLVLTGSGDVDVPEELAEHVLDIGFASEEEKQQAMAGAVAFCHPSTNESLSIVILESWLAGTPVLVSANGSVMPYQCKRSNGGLWFSNYPEFEEALQLVLDHPDVGEAMAKSGREFVLREYSWKNVEECLLRALS